MSRKLSEIVKVEELFQPASYTTTGTLFNGSASHSGIDTRDYDFGVVILQTGTFASGASVAFALYESDTADSTAATAVTSADFTTVTSANDLAKQVGQLACKSYKRYLFLRSNKITNTNAAVFSASLILGIGDNPPASNSAVFDV
jgi:hypothetical protein